MFKLKREFPITAGGRDSEHHWVPLAVWMSDLRNPLFLTYLTQAGWQT